MKKIEFSAGTNLSAAYQMLVQKMVQTQEIYWAEFNSEPIFSNDSIDEAYERVLGKSFIEVMNNNKMSSEIYRKKDLIYKSKIPALLKKYKEDTKDIIKTEKISAWNDFLTEHIENSLGDNQDLDIIANIGKFVNNCSKSDDLMEVKQFIPITSSKEYKNYIKKIVSFYLKDGDKISKYLEF